MSRGLGKIQRTVLEALESSDQEIDTLEVAGKVYISLYGEPDTTSFEISEAFYESVRRALKSLERRGLACGMWHTRTGYKLWASRKRAIVEANRVVRYFGVSSLRRNKPLLQLYLDDQASSRIDGG
ncbi:MAG: hypothetical protein OEU26_36030 [Candidatus Tectomicrobia bacterium]|nr:hypothetical protein [Candidatus Tectomicrobia bacterium]